MKCGSLTEPQQRLYIHLVKLTAEQRPTPGDVEIAKAIGCSPGGVATMLTALERRGYILLEGKRTLRSVMVRATGLATRPPQQGEGQPRPRRPAGGKVNPVRAMVERTFAAYQSEEPHRRAMVLQGSASLDRATEAQLAGARVRSGVPCGYCGAANACAHRPWLADDEAG